MQTENKQSFSDQLAGLMAGLVVSILFVAPWLVIILLGLAMIGAI
jgi:hypothetical protein